MITSKENKLIKHIRLLQQKKYRDENSEYIVEGIKMVEEAISENENISHIIICNDLFKGRIQADKYNIEEVDEKVFKSITDTVNPQGILAIVHKKENKKKLGDIVFALDKVQDPGNVGTIIRTLDCAGVSDLILSSDSAEPYNPKVVRSTMGAIYRVNIRIENNLKDMLLELKKEGYKIIATDLDANNFYNEIDYRDKCIIVVGNESNGISSEILEISDIKVKIPMIGRTESLNAGVAASILAYATLLSKKQDKIK